MNEQKLEVDAAGVHTYTHEGIQYCWTFAPVEDIPWVSAEALPTEEMLEYAVQIFHCPGPLDEWFEDFANRWLDRVTEPEIDALLDAIRELLSDPVSNENWLSTAEELLEMWSQVYPEGAARKLRPLCSDMALGAAIKKVLGPVVEP